MVDSQTLEARVVFAYGNAEISVVIDPWGEHMNLCEHKPALLPIQCTFGACGAPENKFMTDSDGFRVDLFRQVGPLYKRLQVVFLINFIELSIE